MEGSARSNGKKIDISLFLKKWRAGMERECWQQKTIIDLFSLEGVRRWKGVLAAMEKNGYQNV